MDNNVRDILLAYNPWQAEPGRWDDFIRERLPERYLPRTVYGSVKQQWSEIGKVHLVIGPRQAGKSTLIWKHLHAVGPNVLFISLEDRNLRTWCSSPAIFVRDIKENLKGILAIFFDEAQNLDEAGLFMKGVVDLNVGCPVIVSGSSSYHLRSRTRESLAGRATRTTLLPFSLAEVFKCDKNMSAAAVDAALSRTFGTHIIRGGYPKSWFSPGPQFELAGLIEAFIQRDASDFFRIKRPDVMQRLLRLVAVQTGSLVNISEWASICGASRDTVWEYLQICEDSHLTKTVPVFAGGKRAELTSSCKIYLLDTGIRNALVRDFKEVDERTDLGPLVENWVFSELAKNAGREDMLYYWRTKSGAEVDFVLDTTPGLIGYEVKASFLSRPVLSRSSRSFIEAYKPHRFVVLNFTFSHEELIDGCKVIWRKFSDFGLGAVG